MSFQFFKLDIGTYNHSLYDTNEQFYKPICILHMPISMWFSYYFNPERLNMTFYNHNSGERTYFYDINFSFSCSCHTFYLVDFLKEEGPALKCKSMAKKIFEWSTTFVFEYNILCICHISNTICIGRKCFSDFRRKMMARTFCISPFTFGYFSSLILRCCESHYVGKL